MSLSGGCSESANQQRRTTLLRRPLRCLYPLKCNSGEKQEINTNKKVTESAVGRTRTVRDTAHRANDFIEAVMGAQ